MGDRTILYQWKAETEEIHNPFRYAGEYTDSETGMIYLRARMYDPSIGRFITEDPIRDGLNWYAYCGNNPVNRVDVGGRAYATAVDSYKNISMQVYQSKIDDLESEKELKYQIYQQVVEQLQIAKSILQEKTPAFTVLQNPTVPSLPSSRSRKATVAIWLILGVAIRCTMLAWKNREKFIVE